VADESRLDLDQIRAVIQIASEAADIAELEVQSPTLRIVVRKTASGARAAPAAHPPAASPPPVAAPEPDHLVPITAPMVGTFYRAPSPDAPPFVSEGDLVEPGQTVCIIEAMKLFNEIQSEIRGRIARILVENAAPVEYGQTLMLVDTSADGA
jgi:oxaloacetate decarboxylase alpha subunit